jgi:hypothetical protein
MAKVLGDELRRPDSAGRISLGKKYKDKLFAVRELPNGDIVLSPVVVRHEREAWLYANPEAMAMVDEGLRASAAGDIHYLGSFAQYADDEDDED